MGQSLGRSIGNIDYKLHRGQISFKWMLGITFLFVFPIMAYSMFSSKTNKVSVPVTPEGMSFEACQDCIQEYRIYHPLEYSVLDHVSEMQGGAPYVTRSTKQYNEAIRDCVNKGQCIKTSRTTTSPGMDVTFGNILGCIICSLLISLILAGIYQFSMSFGYGRAQSICKGRKDYEACLQQQFNKQDIMGAVSRRRYY